MPLLWDIWMSSVAGFVFSSLKPLIESKFKRFKLNDMLFFSLGLLFNQLVIVLISVWIYTEIDPNWIMLYWIDPKILGNAIHFIYACFPLFYLVSYKANKRLIKLNRGRFSLLVAATSWIILTVLVSPNFFIVFKNNDAPTHGVDYSAQYLWHVTSFPSENLLWIIPIDLGLFFLAFFVIVIFLLVIFELLGLIVAWKDHFKPKSNL